MVNRYNQEIDIVSFIYLLRKVKILLQFIYTNQQLFFLNYDISSNLSNIKNDMKSSDWI